MKSRILWLTLGGLGLLFILSSLIITFAEFQGFKHLPVQFPADSQIADVPVGGLNPSEATERLTSSYNTPLRLEIEGATLLANPDELGLVLDAPHLVEQAVSEIDQVSFWAYLWKGHHPQPVVAPLDAEVDKAQVLDYLNREIIPRYTQAGSPITPILGTTNFQVFQGGTGLDIDSAVEDIQAALLSPTVNTVSLKMNDVLESQVDIGMLEAFLKFIIQEAGFDELVEVYLESMQNGEILHFAVDGYAPVAPDIAFTAASAVKIPIMVSVLRRTPEPTPEKVAELMRQMIVLSENPPADTLMSAYLDPVRGPLIVSEDLAELGLGNTFLAGFFAPGSPVLQLFETPANTRRDIFLNPDIYNQTVPAETGRLLSAIYSCAKAERGLLVETFPGEITRDECQLMLDILAANRLGILIEAGLPPEASVAHKHGWVVALDGLIHSMSDSGVVFTSAGDYVLTIFIYDPERLDFDQGNRLIARLSQTVYNFFNLDNQAYWWID